MILKMNEKINKIRHTIRIKFKIKSIFAVSKITVFVSGTEVTIIVIKTNVKSNIVITNTFPFELLTLLTPFDHFLLSISKNRSSPIIIGSLFFTIKITTPVYNTYDLTLQKNHVLILNSTYAYQKTEYKTHMV